LKKRGHLPFERSGRGAGRGKRFSERSEWYKSFSEVKTWQVDAFLWRAFLGSFFSKKNEQKIRRILLGS